MDSQYLRNCLYEYFSNKEFTRKMLKISGILSVVMAGLQLLASIFNSLWWLDFSGATNLIMVLTLIFAFSASDFKYIFIAIAVKLLSMLISIFKMITGYHYGFTKFIYLVGYIIIMAVYSYLLYLTIKKLQSTGEWQSSIKDIKTQFNQGVNNFQNNFNNATNQYQNQQQQYKQQNNQQQNQQPQNMYANANYINQGNGLVYKPISTFGYIGYMLLFCIPLIGLILLIVFALTAGNQNLKNFARSYFCLIIIIVIVMFIVFVVSGGFFLSRFY